MTLIQKFIAKVREIVASKPTYRQPGDGSDGTCDCIGLIIGAIRRMGLKWTGIHGSNYAARRASVNFRKISSASDLSIGDMVFKGYKPGESKYKLPDRYKKGGQYYNGDLTDYYHVGIVTSVNPLEITHMTSPTAKVDTKLGKWGYAAHVKQLADAGAYEGVPEQPTTEPEKPKETEKKPEATSGATAIVTAPSGRYVKMRQKPSTSCRLYDEIPIGAKVTLVKPGETWAQINYGNRKGWFMMAKFLNVAGETA